MFKVLTLTAALAALSHVQAQKIGQFSRDQIVYKEIHPREKRQETSDALKRQTTTNAGPGADVCSRAINRLKNDQVDYNQILQGVNDDPTSVYLDETFMFPDSIHWEDLPATQWNLDGDVPVIDWARIRNVFPESPYYSMWGSTGLIPADAIQGQLGNCWLISAAMSTAEKEERVYNMFDIEEKNSAGIYSSKLWLLGMPVSVTVDDYLPLTSFESADYGKLYYTRYANVSQDGAIWGTILEKSFAKLLGNYEIADAGHGAFGVEVMTGAPYNTISHATLTEEGREEELWTALLASNDNHEMITNGSYTGNGSDQTQNADGLPYNHAFSVMRAVVVTDDDGVEHRLVEIRNPWGMEYWAGDWSDSSTRWTDSLRLQVDHTSADDGKFYMSFADYVTNIEYTDFNQDLSDWFYSAFAVFGDDEPVNAQTLWYEDPTEYNVHTLTLTSAVAQRVRLSSHTYHYKHYHGACVNGAWQSYLYVQPPGSNTLYGVYHGSQHWDIIDMAAGETLAYTIYTSFVDADEMPHDWSFVAYGEQEAVTIEHEDGRASASFTRTLRDSTIATPQDYDTAVVEPTPSTDPVVDPVVEPVVVEPVVRPLTIDDSLTIEENVDRLFQLCDTDLDDYLTRSEHKSCAKQTYGEDSYAVEMWMDFFHKDLNEDGQISRDEAKYVLDQTISASAVNVDPSIDFSVIFQFMDSRNPDGEIDQEEFKAVWTGLFSDWTYMELIRVFTYADSDNSGTLSWQESSDEYDNQASYERKFDAVDSNKDGFVDLSEWVARPIFNSVAASDSSIRNRFTTYDTNGDGHIHFMELYTNIRANQVRWTNFSKLWEELDPTGDLWTDIYEGLEGLQRYKPDFTAAEAEALFNSYDQNGDGRVHKLDMWAQQSKEASKEWDTENQEFSLNVQFYPHWVQYDANLDDIATWEEVRAARELLEDETATRYFYDWYYNVSADHRDANATVDGIIYEDAAKQWQQDKKSLDEFTRYWLLVDSDNNGEVTKEDMYAAQDLIKDFDDATIETYWQQCLANSSTGVCNFSAACKSNDNPVPWMCEDGENAQELNEYSTWKAEFYAMVIGMHDTDADGDIDRDEFIAALTVEAEWPSVDEFFSQTDDNGDSQVTESELISSNWPIYQQETEALQIWASIDPSFSGAVERSIAELFVTSAFNVTTIDWDVMDANSDSYISAQEACQYAPFGYPYQQRCTLLPSSIPENSGSGMSMSLFSQLWTMADVSQDGTLDLSEFYVLVNFMIPFDDMAQLDITKVESLFNSAKQNQDSMDASETINFVKSMFGKGLKA